MASLMIIDGNSIINRAFFGLGSSASLTTPDGTPIGAVYTFLSMFLRYFNEYKPSHICIAFDTPDKTFRHEISDSYKATRKGMPEELAVQMPILKSCLEALRVYQVELSGYEADDLIGTFSSRYSSEDLPVFILSGDRDDFQLLDANVSQIYPQNRGQTTLFTPELIVEKYGIRPDQVVDLKALMGDSSDNIPGVKGVGEKTATKLLQEYDTLDNIYANLDEIKGSLQKKLADGKDSAYLSQVLATIDCAVPIDVTLDDLVLQEWDKPRLLEQFTSLGFRTMISSFGLTDEDSKEAEQPKQKLAEIKEASFGDTVLPAETKLVSVVLLEPASMSATATVSTSASDGNRLRLLLATDAGSELVYAFPEAGTEVIRDYLKNLQDQGITLATYNWKPIYKQLNFYPKTEIFDLSVAAYLVDITVEGKTLAEIYQVLTEKPLAGVEPGEDDLTRGVHEASAQLVMVEILQERVAARELTDLMRDMEIPLISVLAGMEKRGVKVDGELLRKMGRDFNARGQELEQEIYELAGHSFNINSPKQLGDVLYQEMGIASGKKTSTGAYSTAASELEKLAPFYPIVEKVLDYRRISKLDSTFIQGLLKEIQEDGRIHTTYHQTLTTTGRLSSSDPNLQNIPMREEEGRKIRQAFVADSGYVFLDADYSQIELRLLAVLSKDKNLLEAFANGEDIHVRTAASIFGVDEKEVTKEQRAAAKTVNFSIIYGISDFGLAQDLKISRKEASEYIDGYHRQYPAVKPYMDSLVEFGHQHGYVETYFGRRRYIEELKSKNANVRKFGERAAMNAPVQGTAADVMKIAMLRTEAALAEAELDANILLQVHDELLLEVREDHAEEAAKILQEAMEKAADLPIPLKVEVGQGPNWFECK